MAVSARGATATPRGLRRAARRTAPARAAALRPKSAVSSGDAAEAAAFLHVALPQAAAGARKVALGGAAAAAPLLALAGEAAAKGGEYGILEGRTSALIHPAIMATLLGVTVYAGYLGLQWRQARTLGEEISALKAQVPAEVTADGEPAPPSAAALAITAEIDEKSAKRKEILSAGVRDKHYDAGNLLLAMGVLISLEGGMNTYLRVGKLFPGPHLFAGLSITALWAAAAALVPYMQKGNDTARSLHIALNTVNLALFIWQVPTGWAIVQKVFQFTSWP